MKPEYFNNFQKVVHAAIWFGDKLMLSQVVKNCYHKGFWSDVGGKVEKGEFIERALVREVQEESGLFFPPESFVFIDCFIYPKRELKCFLYEVHLPVLSFREVKNVEPHKQSDWQLFTHKQALKLKLMPSVEFYLKNF